MCFGGGGSAISGKVRSKMKEAEIHAHAFGLNSIKFLENAGSFT